MGRELTDEEAAVLGLPPAASVKGGAVAEAPQANTEPPPDLATLEFQLKKNEGERKSNDRISMWKKLLAATQTGSMGMGDEMSGAVSAVKGLATGSPYTMGEDYRRQQQIAERAAKTSQKEHPLASLAGAVPSMFVPGGQSGAARVGLAALTGVASGVGDAPGGASAKDVGKDALDHGATAAGLQTGLEIVSPTLGKLAKGLRGAAGGQYAKAAGLQAGIKNAPQKLGLESADEVSQLGREMKDAGLIPFGATTGTVLQRGKALQKSAGKEVGEALWEGSVSGIPADYDAAQWAAIKPAMESTVLARSKSGKPVLDLVRALRKQADETPGSWEMLNRTKSDLGSNINWNAAPQGTGKLVKKTYGALNEDIARQLEKAAGSEAAERLVKGNKDFGTASDAVTLASNADTRGMTKYALPALLASAGGALGLTAQSGSAAGLAPLAGAFLGGVARDRGPAVFGPALDRASELSGLLQAVNKAPAAVGVAGDQLAESVDPDDALRQRILEYLKGMGK